MEEFDLQHFPEEKICGLIVKLNFYFVSEKKVIEIIEKMNTMWPDTDMTEICITPVNKSCYTHNKKEE